MPDAILALDAGGTAVKYALLDETGRLLPGTVASQAAASDADAETILNMFAQVGQDALHRAAALGVRLRAVSVSIPGPFDYPRGISHMTHKYAAIHGLPLAPAILRYLPPMPVVFLHDSTAFLLGEMTHGAQPLPARAAGVMLGTGFGFASTRDGRVQVGPDYRPAVIVWNAPLRDGTVEDYVSRRAIRARDTALRGGNSALDVHEIAQLAQAGDKIALSVFEALSVDLAEVLQPILHRLDTQYLVIGGQIAKASALFLPGVQARLSIPVYPAAHPEHGALYGAWRYASEGSDHCILIQEREAYV